MIKNILIALLILTTVSCTEDEINDFIANTSVSNEEVVEGLKTALQVGTDTSVSILNKLDGYYADAAVKILLPAEAQVVYDKLSLIPGGNILLEETIKTMNRAAEDAASEAKPIFINAITNMSFTDALQVLNGSDTAATAYLKSNTSTQLTQAFSPKIDASLNKEIIGDISANSAYIKLIEAYNKASLDGFLFNKITTNTLGQHVTQKALDGLFLKVAEEEKAIRTDPLARVTEILKKVFSK